MNITCPTCVWGAGEGAKKRAESDKAAGAKPHSMGSNTGGSEAKYMSFEEQGTAAEHRDEAHRRMHCTHMLKISARMQAHKRFPPVLSRTSLAQKGTAARAAPASTASPSESSSLTSDMLCVDGRKGIVVMQPTTSFMLLPPNRPIALHAVCLISIT